MVTNQEQDIPLGILAETKQTEHSVVAEGRSYLFTIQPGNESLVSCTIGSEESD